MYAYPISLDGDESLIYHQNKFNAIEFAEIYNKIANDCDEYTEFEKIVEKFCDDYGFYTIETPVTLNLCKIGVSYFANMYAVDIPNISNTDNYIDVYDKRKLTEAEKWDK